VVVADAAPDDETQRVTAKTVAAVRDAMQGLRFNVAVAKITELNNHVTAHHGAAGTGAPRQTMETLLLLLAPLAPHLSEELWTRLGHDGSLAWQPFPEADPALLVDETVEIPVQVNGKLRARIHVVTGLDRAALEAAARADDKVADLLDGATVRKVVAVPDRLINFVVA
jgi:leucyl-tRNA synthetase